MRPLAVRLMLAALFLTAGLPKLLDPGSFALQIAAYQVLPQRLVTLAALVIPWLEVLSAACLAMGLLSRSSALLLGLWSLVMGGAVFSALTRGLQLDCGCFPGPSPLSWGHLLLDLAVGALAALALVWGPGPYALDRERSVRRRKESGGA